MLASPANVDQPSFDAFPYQTVGTSNTLSLEDTPMDITLPPFPDYNLDWQDVMENIQDFSVPDQIRDHDSPRKSVLAGEICQDRVIYAVKWLKSLPRRFVVEGQIPFIHKSLYGLHPPHAIQDILGACALYIQKNEANEGLVYRNLTQQADRLVENYANSSALEQLAAVQSLALLQIIRFFDGDIRQRADAERTESLFLQWIHQLQHRLKESDGMSQIDDSWQSWLLSESLRRTIIMGYTLQGFYCFLKNGWDDSHHEFNKVILLCAKGTLDCSIRVPMAISSWETSSIANSIQALERRYFKCHSSGY